QSVNNQAIAAVGKSKDMFVWTVVKRTIGIGCMVGGLALFGMKGLLAGVVFSTWFAYIVNISLVSKHVGYKWSDQLLSILPVALASIVAAFIALEASRLLSLSLFADGLVKLSVYAIVYMTWSIVFRPEAFEYFKSIITPMLRKFKEKNTKL
ncbi:MAG: polysaccharide biosynthesis C-terminal domain-containing protein, partial [Aeriscardovia sp.]|nr:polysaccharide biosynthesis C-terminal domain-containing protein [Aeriscardovia sp.]